MYPSDISIHPVRTQSRQSSTPYGPTLPTKPTNQNTPSRSRLSAFSLGVKNIAPYIRPLAIGLGDIALGALTKATTFFAPTIFGNPRYNPGILKINPGVKT